jgi:hypothetical protein
MQSSGGSSLDAPRHGGCHVGRVSVVANEDPHVRGGHPACRIELEEHPGVAVADGEHFSIQDLRISKDLELTLCGARLLVLQAGFSAGATGKGIAIVALLNARGGPIHVPIATPGEDTG